MAMRSRLRRSYLCSERQLLALSKRARRNGEMIDKRAEPKRWANQQSTLKVMNASRANRCPLGRLSCRSLSSRSQGSDELLLETGATDKSFPRALNLLPWRSPLGEYHVP
jgi:hypothetical protein